MLTFLNVVIQVTVRPIFVGEKKMKQRFITKIEIYYKTELQKNITAGYHGKTGEIAFE